MSKSKKKNGKLFIKVVLIVTLVVAALSTMETAVIATTAKKITTNSNTELYKKQASIYSNLLAKTLEEYMGHLDFYTKSDIVKTKDTETIVNWLRDHEKNRIEKFDYVAYVDAEGNFYSDIGSQTKIPDRDYFLGIMKQGKSEFIDNPVTSKTSGQTIIHICKEVVVDGSKIGFFCAVVNLKHLVVLLEDIDIGNDGAAVLFSGKGDLIAFEGEKSVMGDSNNPKVQAVNNILETSVSTAVASKRQVSTWQFMPGAGNEFFIMNPVEHSPWCLSIILKGNVIYGIGTKLGNIMIFFSILLSIGIIFSIGLLLFISLKPLNTVEKAIRDIATGNADLTKRIDLKSNDEIGRVVEGFNLFSAKLQEIISAMKDSKNQLVDAGDNLKASTEDTSAAITQIIANIESMGTNISNQTGSVNETAGAVNEIASNIESLNRMIEQQASAVTQASAAVEQMIGNINSVNSSVQKMAKAFEDLETKAAVGVQKQDDVNEKIHVIESESQALKEANSVISNIAEQTNLLAMNAAIEAAHAGEAGKGFSVVADEIRKLSETSASQTKTIGDQLNRITDSINNIVLTSQEAKSAFGDVSEGMKEVAELVSEISISMNEQGEGSKQISIALNHMTDSSQEVKTSSFEMSEGNKAILEEIKNLQNATFSMKSGMDEMSVGATKINETGRALSDLAANMEQSIKNIGEQVDQFKV